MRLREKELKAIKAFFAQFNIGNLYLFGSRLDDSKRGGDIDLLWIVSAEVCQELRDQKSNIIYDLQGFIGEQRVDLTIVTPEQLQTDLFLQSVLESNPILLCASTAAT